MRYGRNSAPPSDPAMPQAADRASRRRPAPKARTVTAPRIKNGTSHECVARRAPAAKEKIMMRGAAPVQGVIDVSPDDSILAVLLAGAIASPMAIPRAP